MCFFSESVGEQGRLVQLVTHSDLDTYQAPSKQQTVQGFKRQRALVGDRLPPGSTETLDRAIKAYQRLPDVSDVVKTKSREWLR